MDTLQTVYVSVVWVCLHRVGDGVNLVHHGVVTGEVPGHLPREQVQAGQHLHVEHQDGDDHRLGPGCDSGHSASHGRQQICL